MVISKKPLQFILALTMALMPFVTTANPTNDSTKVEAHAAPKTAEVAHEEGHSEPQDEKSKIKEFINHHLLDSHSFNFNANEETGEHYGFSLPIHFLPPILFFHHQNSITEKKLLNIMEIIMYCITKKYIKLTLQVN